MPMSSQAVKRSGFTLIELVLVLSLLAVMLSYALPQNTALDGRRLQQEQQRLSYLISYAKQQALQEMHYFGLGIMQDSYIFFRLEDNQWKTLQRSKLMKRHQLTSPAHFKLLLEGRQIVLLKEDITQPHIFFSSDGQLSSFKLSLINPQQGLEREINSKDLRRHRGML